MRFPNGQRGAINFKLVIFLVALFYGIFVAIKLFPVWADDKAIPRKITEVLRFSHERALKTVPEVHNEVWSEIQDALERVEDVA